MSSLDKKEQKKPIVMITCVHGTWARGPFGAFKKDDSKRYWYHQESPTLISLKQIFLENGLEPDFRYFEWSGSNSLTGRRIAAGKLRDYLTETAKASRDCPHYVIAHSHGGNIALYAIKLMREKHRPSGLFTLATPFLIFSRRHLTRVEQVLWSAFENFIRLGSFFGLTACIIGAVGWITEFLPESMRGIFFALSSYIVIVSLYNCFGPSSKLFITMKSHIQKTKKRAELFSSNRTIYPTKLYVMRAPGDEAALLLALGSFVELLNSGMRSAISFLANTFERLYDKWVGRTRYSFEEILEWIFFGGIGLSMVGFIALVFISMFFLDNGPVFAFLAGFSKVLYGTFLSIFFSSIAIFLLIAGAAVITLITTSLSLCFFGIEYLPQVWSAEVAAEPIPESIDSRFYLVRRSKSGLRHGIYNSQAAQEQIALLIRENTMSPNEHHGA